MNDFLEYYLRREMNLFVMNVLSLKKRKQIFEMVCEGKSVRAISTMAGVNWETAKKYREIYMKLLEEKGKELQKKIDQDIDEIEKEPLKLLKKWLGLL